MHSIESQFFMIFNFFIDPLVLGFLVVFPAHQQLMVVKKQFPGGIAVLRQQPGVVVGGKEIIILAFEVSVAQDIDIMD